MDLDDVKKIWVKTQCLLHFEHSLHQMSLKTNPKKKWKKRDKWALHKFEHIKQATNIT